MKEDSFQLTVASFVNTEFKSSRQGDFKDTPSEQLYETCENLSCLNYIAYNQTNIVGK